MGGPVFDRANRFKVGSKEKSLGGFEVGHGARLATGAGTAGLNETAKVAGKVFGSKKLEGLFDGFNPLDPAGIFSSETEGPPEPGAPPPPPDRTKALLTQMARANTERELRRSRGSKESFSGRALQSNVPARPKPLKSVLGEPISQNK